MKTLIVMFALASGIAAASEWMVVAESDTGTKMSIRVGSIREAGSYRRAWVLMEPSIPFPSGARSSITLREFDCDGERERLLSFTAYAGPGGTGKVLGSDSEGGDWDYINPGSIMGSVSDLVCDARVTLAR
jgi:hypothetical protein